jgi:hypothetical protein
VLRKEDEIKYEKILPTIADVPDVVTSKLAGLATSIRQRQGTLVDALDDAGYDVGRFRTRQQNQPVDLPKETPVEQDANGKLWATVNGAQVEVVTTATGWRTVGRR